MKKSKKYENAELEILIFNAADIIATSLETGPLGGEGDGTNEGYDPDGWA